MSATFYYKRINFMAVYKADLFRLFVHNTTDITHVGFVCDTLTSVNILFVYTYAFAAQNSLVNTIIYITIAIASYITIVQHWAPAVFTS